MSLKHLALILLFVPALAVARSPLEPLKTDHPRDTMKSFMDAITDYKLGVEKGDQELEARLLDAVRTLDLSNEPALTRAEKGKETAILLKEVIDRVIVIDLSKVPEDSTLERWRLKGTEIVISKMTEGERAGEYLFSSATVSRAKDFYTKVKKLPYLEGTSRGALYSAPWQEAGLPSWAMQSLLGYKAWQIAGLLLSIFIGVLLKLFVQWVWSLFQVFVSKRPHSFRYKAYSAFEKPIGLIASTGFWFFSVHFLKFEGLTQAALLSLVKVSLGFSVVWAAYRFIEAVEVTLTKWAEKTESDLDDHLVPLIVKSARVLIVIFGALLVIQNLGFNVMSLLAGLGLGGLAFALAAKDTAANFFGSLMILIDQPFRIGDWIKTSDVEGTVESIGFRSTRVRTFYNSLISVPNSTLATTNVDNLGLREYRRTVANLGITYDTPTDKIEAFLEGIKNILFAHPKVRKDYFHVVFSDFGDFSLNVMVYFFLRVDDWSEELVEKQNIYLQIMDLAAELGVEFAFPTQTLHVETFPEKNPTVIRHKGDQADELKKLAERYSAKGDQSRPSGKGLFVPPYKSPEVKIGKFEAESGTGDADGDGL